MFHSGIVEFFLLVMPDFVLTAKINKTSLDRAIAMAMDVSKQEPQNLLLNVARGVTLKAKAKTPFVKQETIDRELDVIVTPKIGKHGKVLSQKYAKNKIYSGGTRTSYVEGVPLAALIIQASADPNSRYNQLTNMRWLRESPFKGVSRKVGAERMAATIHRLIAARHSSTNFLQAGWSAVYQKLTQLFKFSRYGGMPQLESNVPSGSKTFAARNKDFGAVTSGGTGTKVWLMIENNIGMKGKNAENYNHALHLHGGPALQAAVDEQAAEMETRYRPRWEAAMAEKWNLIR